MLRGPPLVMGRTFCSENYLVTRNTTSLNNVAAGVVTLTLPYDAPAGTNVVISPGATIVKVADLSLVHR